MDSSLMSVLRQVAALGLEMNAEQIKLFGSRARGDCRQRSDIDLAVFGLQPGLRNRFIDAVEALPTLLDFDLVFIGDDTDEALRQNIEKDGVALMGRLDEKYSKLALAVVRLGEGIEEYRGNRSDTVRDGVIQRFEFCTELAWKTAREYLIEQGHAELNSPKTVMRQAYADGLVSDSELWASLLNDRNLTSHIYDEATASAVFGRIASDYLGMFQELLSALKRD